MKLKKLFQYQLVLLSLCCELDPDASVRDLETAC